MQKSCFKRISAFLLAMLLFSVVLGVGPVSAHAAGDVTQVYMVVFPRPGEAAAGSNWGHPTLVLMNGWYAVQSTRTILRATGSTGGPIAYCIEPGPNQHTGDVLISHDEDFWDNFPPQYNSTLAPDDIKLLVGRILQYGYTGPLSAEWRTQTDAETMSFALATQFLIWEVIVGERDADFNKVPTGSYSAVLDQLVPDYVLRDKVLAYYATIESRVKTHTVLPSMFARSTARAGTVDLQWDGSRYAVTLTDTNHVLANYAFSSDDPGLHFSTDGDALTIWTDTAPAGTVSVTADKVGSQRMGLITWSDGSYGPTSSVQDVVSYTQSVNDPVSGFLNIKVSLGSARIIKTSEDGQVAGVPFTVTGNGVDRSVTTGAYGEIQIDDLTPGLYTVTETVADRYRPQQSQQVNVLAGQVASVSFNNTLKRGSLTVTKTSEDGLATGIRFHLTGTALNGQPVDAYATTDSTGKATFPDLLAGNGYVLEEMDTATRYVVPASQRVDIAWGAVTQKSVENRLKKWRATLTKTDSETGTAQGDAKLAGAVYGVYRGEELVDTYTTDAGGKLTTRYYPCGENWSIREIKPGEGYLLDKTVHAVGAAPGQFTVEYNTLTAASSEQVIKGNLSILKHTDDGDTQVETPEIGAEFQVYLKSAGSYAKAKDSEKDTLVCDEFGYAESKPLPYGIYTVHQSKGHEGRALLPDFDVYISANGKTYRYLANNAAFQSHVKIVKKDAESGKTIPLAGAGFQLYGPDGALITQTVTYPEPAELDTFYTATDGTLITPKPLDYGTGYSLVEVTAPYGYVLDKTPVSFDIVARDATGDASGVTVVEVEKRDTAQKGILHVKKSGEVFAGVRHAGDLYLPVYAVQGLPGAVYEITAAEDIVTPDGTRHAARGEVVDTLTTGPDGLAQSKPLYLGRYEVREITAPQGMVLNTEPCAVALTYAGQDVALTEAQAGFANDRQKAALSLDKVLEQDETFGLGGAAGLAKVTFGLYAAETITAADGSAIPRDGLIERVQVAENGHAQVQADLPFGSYYLQELTTDAHYLLNTKKYPVSFTCAGQDTALIELTANDGRPVANSLIRGEVHGLKLDDNATALAGAEFGLFAADATAFTADEALLTATADADGVFTFADVPYGDWLVRELLAPEGYLLDERIFPVTIDADGDVAEITAVDDRIVGTVQLTKVDRDYPQNRLTGAVFELYRDTDGDHTLNAGDERIGEVPEVTTGVYELGGLPYGDYLVRETKAPDGFYPDTGVYPFAIREQGKTVVVENEAGKGFVNAPRVGALKIVKTASDGRVEGFSFRVAGPDGYDKTFATDARGEILIEGLRLGEYTISEVNDGAAANYILPEARTAAVPDGEVVTVTMHNILRDTPQTGDRRNPAVWWGLMAVAAVGVAVCLGMYLYTRRKAGKRGDAE